MKRFRNDWATEELIKQFFKNKRSRAYQQGWLEVPTKYTYLKDNAGKRSTDGSRVKKANAILAAKKNKRRQNTKAKGKGKATQHREIEEDEEEEEEGSGKEHDDEMEVVDDD